MEGYVDDLMGRRSRAVDRLRLVDLKKSEAPGRTEEGGRMSPSRIGPMGGASEASSGVSKGVGVVGRGQALNESLHEWTEAAKKIGNEVAKAAGESLGRIGDEVKKNGLQGLGNVMKNITDPILVPVGKALEDSGRHISRAVEESGIGQAVGNVTLPIVDGVIKAGEEIRRQIIDSQKPPQAKGGDKAVVMLE